MRIYIYAGFCIPVYADVLQERPLGGTETGVVRVAHCLRALGHEVVVFTSHQNPPPERAPLGSSTAGSLLFRPAGEILRFPPCDLLLVVQDWRGAFLPVQAARRFYWTGDGPEQYVTFGVGDRRAVERLDGLLAVSSWHRQGLAQESGFPINKIHAVYNGIEPSLFQGSERRDRLRLIYTAAPHRGLALAPLIFTQILEQLPQAELHIFSGLDIYDREKPYTGPEQQQFSNIRQQLQKIKNCYVHGNVTQERLARELMKSAVLFYPNIVRETFCIGLLEGQAAGIPAVTSDLGGLKETVGAAGFALPLTDPIDHYCQNFAQHCLRLLTDEQLWQTQHLAALNQAASASWQVVTERILAATSKEISNIS